MVASSRRVPATRAGAAAGRPSPVRGSQGLRRVLDDGETASTADLEQRIERATGPYHLFHMLTEDPAVRLHMTRRLIGDMQDPHPKL